MRRIDDNEHLLKRDIAILRRDNAGRTTLAVTDQTRLCMNCNQSILQEIQLVEEDDSHIRLNVLTQTRSASCFICNEDVGIQRLSIQTRVNIFIKSNIYIPNNVGSCLVHLNENGFLLQPLHIGLRSINRPYIIKGAEVQNLIVELRVNASTPPHFKDEDDFNEEDFQAMTSLKKEQFLSIFEYIEPVSAGETHEYVKKKDLIMFLTKMRHGLSDNTLKLIFNYSTRRLVSYVIS